MFFKWYIFLVISFIFSTAGFAAANSSNIDMNDGRWEITIKMEMENIPFAMPPMTYTTCLTNKDLIPVQDEASDAANCKMTRHEVKGNTVNWSITCNDDGVKTTSKGKITYAGDSFKGEMTVQTPDAPPMVQKMSGHRVGSCD